MPFSADGLERQWETRAVLGLRENEEADGGSAASGAKRLGVGAAGGRGAAIRFTVLTKTT